MEVLEQVKKLLGTVKRDDLLNTVIDLTEARLKNLLGGADSVPERLLYVVVEVSIIRYNRIGSEGFKSHSVEGQSITFPDSDFEQYSDDIAKYLATNDQNSDNKTRIKFI